MADQTMSDHPRVYQPLARLRIVLSSVSRPIEQILTL